MLTLFPDPTHDVLQLRLERFTGPALYRIPTANRRVVRETRLVSSTERMDASALPKGTYILQVMNVSGMIAQSRFIKA